jgi:(+)-pinoresinol hydroxylase
LEERTDLTPQVVLFYIRQGVAMMAPFRKTELSDKDAKAIADYLSRARTVAIRHTADPPSQNK